MEAPSLTSSGKVFEWVKQNVPLEEVEEIWVLALDSQCRLLQNRLIARGTTNFCSYHPRDLARFIVLSNAVSFIMIHNHPSQDLRPSSQDLKWTQQLKRIGCLLQIPMVDHLIVTERSFFSFADHVWSRKQRGDR